VRNQLANLGGLARGGGLMTCDDLFDGQLAGPEHLDSFRETIRRAGRRHTQDRASVL
jgi:hypothetical protein